MATRKVTFNITAEVIAVVEEGVDMCDLELDLISQNDNAHVEDFQITDSDVIDSK